MCTCEGLKTDVLLSLFPQLNAKQTLSKFRCKICHTPSNASGKIRGKRKGVVTCAVRKRGGFNFWAVRHKLEKNPANFSSEMKILTKNLLEKLNLAFWILLLLFFIFFINHQVISQVRNWGYKPYFYWKRKIGFRLKVILGTNGMRNIDMLPWTFQISAKPEKCSLNIQHISKTRIISP